ASWAAENTRRRRRRASSAGARSFDEVHRDSVFVREVLRGRLLDVVGGERGDLLRLAQQVPPVADERLEHRELRRQAAVRVERARLVGDDAVAHLLELLV